MVYLTESYLLIITQLSPGATAEWKQPQVPVTAQISG